MFGGVSLAADAEEAAQLSSLLLLLALVGTGAASVGRWGHSVLLHRSAV